MKTFYKIYFGLLIVLVIGTVRVAGQTTQEEYNFITKGYKVQLDSGLDMKKGYLFTDYGKYSLSFGSEQRECEFKGLTRQGQTKHCAIMMIYRRTDIPNGQVFFICIPSADAPDEIWKQTLKVINTDLAGTKNLPLMQTVIWALMRFGSGGYTQ
jgi:hypothetical protein